MSLQTSPSDLRILCYAPYNRWELHGQWEMTILNAIRHHGAKIKYVMCDGLFRECDVFWGFAEGYPRPQNACLDCQSRVTNLAYRMKMPYEWLGRYSYPEDSVQVEEWLKLQDDSLLVSALWQGMPVGEWVKSSLHSHFRINDLDMSHSQLREVYRGYLYSGAMAILALERLFDFYQPHILFQFNGRQSTTRIAVELALMRGIRVIAHERGSLTESISLVENKRITDFSRVVRTSWCEHWSTYSLNNSQLHLVEQFLIQRQQGKASSWQSFSPPLQEIQEVKDKLRLTSTSRVWVLFTSSEDEVVAEPDLIGPFKNQEEWIIRTIEWVRLHPELTLIIRVHPNTSGVGYRKLGLATSAANQNQLDFFNTLAKSSLPENVRLIMPEDKISSYTLMNLADLGLVLYSTVALEMACKGKPVIIGGKHYLSKYEFAIEIEQAENYEDILEQHLDYWPMSPEEVKRKSWRAAYHYFFRYSIPFPLVEMPDPHTGKVRYQSLDALKPGQDEALDRIVAIFLRGESIVATPNAFEQLQSEDEERAFFGLTPAYQSPVVLHEQIWVTPAVAQTQPIVSVIIPCYNYGHYLADAVHSLWLQNLDDFEVIIIDDGSTDRTTLVAQQLMQAYPERAITLIQQPNSGQPALSRNRGISQATGKYILCLDADDKIGSRYLDSTVQCLEENHHLAIAYPTLREFDGSHNTWTPHAYNFCTLTIWNFIPTAALFRRTAWEAVGGYAINVKSHEDWDFWIRLGRSGYFGMHVPDAIFYYRIHEDGLLSSQVAARQNLRAQLVLNHPGLYTHQQQIWAQGVLSQNPDALAIDTDNGTIPRFKGETDGAQAQQQQALFVRLQQEAELGGSVTIALRQWLKEISFSPLPKVWELTIPPQLMSTVPIDKGYACSLAPSEQFLPSQVEVLRRAGQLWVPTQAAVDLLTQANVETDIIMLPPFLQKLHTTNYRMIETTKNTCWLSAFSWYTADWQGLLKMYLKAFSTSDDTCLVLLPEGLPIDEVYNKLALWLEEEGYDLEMIPELLVLDPKEVDTEWPALYANAQVFIQPKGLDTQGLWFSRALSMQMPVVAVEWLFGDTWIQPTLQVPSASIALLLSQNQEYQHWGQLQTDDLKNWNQLCVERLRSCLS